MTKAILAFCLFLSSLPILAQAPELDVFMEEQELHCLADNIYNESRGEPQKGQIAVAMVTFNRQKKRGLSICDVVFEKNQFSWTKSFTYNFRDNEVYKKAYELAEWLLNNKETVRDPTYGAVYFHNVNVFPEWAGKNKMSVRIGNHYFYK